MTIGEHFIEHLEGLARREDRGALAALRRGLGKPAGSVTAMMPLVVPFLPRTRDSHGAYFLVASLFALHPESTHEGNMGTTFRQLGDHESAKRRFIALLDCHEDDLHDHLRHAVSLARAKNAPINYRLLLEHCLRWNEPDRAVQLGWAREYWGTAQENAQHQDADQASGDAA